MSNVLLHQTLFQALQEQTPTEQQQSCLRGVSILAGERTREGGVTNSKRGIICLPEQTPRPVSTTQTHPFLQGHWLHGLHKSCPVDTKWLFIKSCLTGMKELLIVSCSRTCQALPSASPAPDVNMTEKLACSKESQKGLKIFNLGEEKLQRCEMFPDTLNGMKSVLWKEGRRSSTSMLRQDSPLTGPEERHGER
ncbi:uncharacterized protein LOC113593252 isoform X2 [Acinonyx jubatus]|uniref:Uncharacterized protein LOC113593252 isoform X2 n=1 Tax=Acinonyx jubatus TaxID=32536 RepID=A0ABM3NK77_ACIJB|nr:uncharacterized protein LOC113593252 isoform X2 [Acinonyx jubatus]